MELIRSILPILQFLSVVWLFRSTEATEGPNLATLGQVAVFVGVNALSMLTAYLLRPKFSRITEDVPNQLSQRGSPIPIVYGRRTVGTVTAWVSGKGKRWTKEITPDDDTPKQTYYYEEGWQILCQGPVKRLNVIREGGKFIWIGPIDCFSTPSGSTISFGDFESFKIYWGEPDQPICTELADASRVGIASNWPNICYIYWISKKLSTTPVWGEITVDLEVEPLALGVARHLGAHPPLYRLTL